jgi:hypothetical protein
MIGLFVLNTSPAITAAIRSNGGISCRYPFALPSLSRWAVDKKAFPAKDTIHSEIQEPVMGRDLSWMDQLQALINHEPDLHGKEESL